MRGRKKIIKSPKEFDLKVCAYLEHCRCHDERPTYTGGLLFLGLNSRQSLKEYADRAEFSDAVKRFKLIIECEYERRLDKPSPTGAIFALKCNFGWKEEAMQVEHRIEKTLNLSELSDEELVMLEKIALRNPTAAESSGAD